MKTFTLPIVKFNRRFITLIALMLLLATGVVAQTTSVYVYSPYAGQVTYRNTPLNISWFTYYVDTVDISYTTDAGATWYEISNNNTSYTYSWTTPDVLTDACTIRVSSSGDPSVYGEVTFKIVENPTIELITPNGGEIWNFGTLADVTWTGVNLPYYLYIDYSTDGGTTWENLTTVYSQVNGGSIELYVPFVTSNQALVKIYDPYYPEVTSDISEQFFTINAPTVLLFAPAAGDAFYIGEETYCSWFTPEMTLVNIDLSTDGGTTWQAVATNVDGAAGFYNWTVIGTPSANCVLRISDVNDATKFGISGTFSLLATPVIALTSPVGGEIFNTNEPVSISWSYNNPDAFYLYLEYSTDNGQNWNYIDLPQITGTSGTYEWVTPNFESDQYKIRVSDYYLPFVTQSSGSFSVLNYPETPICMVTVDSATNRNVVVWEKPVSPLISQFVVYKETDVADVYAPIGTLNYGDVSTFADSSSNPAVKSYRYKLGFTDAAGNTFPAGNYHQTIHLSINQGVGSTWNLIWTDYQGFNVGSYSIYRGSSPDQMSLIASISSSFTSYTDLNATAGTIYYMIEVSNPNGCNPFKSSGYGSSRSNVATNNSLGVAEEKQNINASVYPNPANDVVRIQLKGLTVVEKVEIKLSNMIDQTVYNNDQQAGEVFEIPVADLPSGIYMISILSGGQSFTKKVVVKH